MRGQPHDPGPVAGSLAGRVRCPAPSGKYHERLSNVHRTIYQTPPGQQKDELNHRGGHPADVYKADEGGARAGTPGAWPRPIRQHRPAHPHHAPPRPGGCCEGSHHSPQPRQGADAAQSR